MTTTVGPADLRRAATVFKDLANEIDAIPAVAVSGSMLGMGWAESNSKLASVDEAVKHALTVLVGRMSDIEELLDTSATRYHDTDVDAAKNLNSLGELNGRSLAK